MLGLVFICRCWLLALGGISGAFNRIGWEQQPRAFAARLIERDLARILEPMKRRYRKPRSAAEFCNGHVLDVTVRL